MSHCIELDDYEIANLRALIEACGYPYGYVDAPIRGVNTGDWLGQVYLKLPEVDYPPNYPGHLMAAMSRERS